MKFNPRSRPWHACAMAIAVATLAGWSSDPASAHPPTTPSAASAPLSVSTPRPTWAHAVEQAWQRSLEAIETQGQHRKAQAEQSAAGSWITGAPALELSRRQGQGGAAEGQRETEVGVVLPLWRWGQRDAAVEASQAGADVAIAAEHAARLRIAAQVRDAVAALWTQEAEAQQVAAQLALLQRLAADVDRRVAAGDLAPSDEWAARAESLAAEAQFSEQQRQLQALRSQWQLLTGLMLVPEVPNDGLTPPLASAVEGPDVGAAMAAHPEMQLATYTAERARRRLSLAQASRGEAPELGVGVREERPGQGVAAQHSLGISLRLPFGTSPQSQPRLAAALAEQELAIVSEQRTRARLAAEIELARLQKQSAHAQAELERQRAALLRDRASHIQKSFDAGESALPELLRALTAAAQADSASARQQIAVGIAQLRLQHALGIVP